MEYINGRPAATTEDLVGIVSANLLNVSVERGNIERARRGCRERPALYYVDTLPAKYKPAVYHRFPDLQGQKEAVTLMELLCRYPGRPGRASACRQAGGADQQRLDPERTGPAPAPQRRREYPARQAEDPPR